jgi:hypothetical protein
MARSITIGLASLALVMGVSVAAGPANAGAGVAAAKTSPIAWHQVKVPSGALNLGGQPTMARDGSRNLHAVFLSVASGKYQYWDAKFTPLGAASGSVHKVFSSAWSGLSDSPWLVPGTKTVPMLLVFTGQSGTPGIYNNGCMYAATSASGATWTLSADGYAQSCAGIESESTTMVNGIAETAFNGPGDGFTYHVGHSPLPVGPADSTVSFGVGGGSFVGETVSALDAKGGEHLAVAGFDGLGNPVSKNATYAWDTQIAGSHVRRAPKSGNVQPFQRVAMVSGGTAGLPYLAYCTGATTCTGVRLWDIVHNKTIPLPNSKSSHLVAASAGPAGRVWVAFFKPGSGAGTVTVARTNQAVTKFGPERTFKAAPLSSPTSLQIEGSAGRLDILMDGNNAKNEPTLYHAQVLAPLTLKANKTSLPANGGSITFTVLDAGAHVQGAKVSLLGHSGTTGAKGTVTLKIGKTKPGTYTATAKKGGYAGGKLKIHVT